VTSSAWNVTVWLECSGAFGDDVDRQEAALCHAIDAHPNVPTLQIETADTDKMKRCVPAHMFVFLFPKLNNKGWSSFCSPSFDDDVTGGEDINRSKEEKICHVSKFYHS
jgi:hypothetical protein